MLTMMYEVPDPYRHAPNSSFSLPGCPHPEQDPRKTDSPRATFTRGLQTALHILHWHLRRIPAMEVSYGEAYFPRFRGK